MIYRDTRLSCPECGEEMERRSALRRSFDRCAICAGLFVSEQTLRDMFVQMDPMYVVSFEPNTTRSKPRPCPECRDPMWQERLAKVEIDRCAKHGIWFDREELELALRREQELPPPPSLLARMLNVFRWPVD